MQKQREMNYEYSDLGNWWYNRILFKEKGLYREFHIVAFVDNDINKWGTVYANKKVIPPKQLLELNFDYIVICSLYFKEIKEQLVNELKIQENKIIVHSQLYEELMWKVINKYNDTDDIEIRKIISMWKLSGLNIFGDYRCDEEIYHDVHDEEDPYVFFENKRMYFPTQYPFTDRGGKKTVYNLFSEQGEKSPHLYMKNGEDIKEGSIVVDAGACEGNFALKYIDKIKKLYLIECDPDWMNALKKTFSEYRDKVVFCDKYLGRYDSKNTIRLDTLVQEKIDFLKMDIEGAETDALLGAKRVLETSNAKCSICSYHKQYDEQYIKFILEAYGYHTETSRGYMFYIYDEDILDTLDFRRGIVYAKKEY